MKSPLLFLLIVAPLVSAGTFSSVNTGSCSASGAFPVGCSSNDGITDVIANADATAAGLAVYVLAEASPLNSGNFGGTPTASPTATATASASDSITVPSVLQGAGYLAISPSLTGSFFATCSATSTSFGTCQYHLSFSNSVTFDSVTHNYYGLSGGASSDYVDGDHPWSKTIYPTPLNRDSVWLVSMRFGGVYSLSYSLQASVAISGGGPQGGNAFISGDFADPPSIQILDVNLNPVGVSVLSANGIDYSGTAAPEPSFRLLVAPLLLLIGFKVRPPKHA